MTDYLEMALFVVGWPSLAGASFATVGGLLRRRFGPWALLSLTVAVTVLAVTLVKRLALVGTIFALPAIPALLIAAAVLEWRARRAPGSELWRHVAWGTTAFALPAAVGLAAVLARCTLCGL